MKNVVFHLSLKLGKWINNYVIPTRHRPNNKGQKEGNIWNVWISIQMYYFLSKGNIEYMVYIKSNSRQMIKKPTWLHKNFHRNINYSYFVIHLTKKCWNLEMTNYNEIWWDTYSVTVVVVLRQIPYKLISVWKRGPDIILYDMYWLCASILLDNGLSQNI